MARCITEQITNPENRCTWEPRGNLSPDTVEQWKDKKIKISNGYQDPFDYKAWDLAKEKQDLARLERHKRRYKKRVRKHRALGSVAYISQHIRRAQEEGEDSDSDDEPLIKIKHSAGQVAEDPDAADEPLMISSKRRKVDSPPGIVSPPKRARTLDTDPDKDYLFVGSSPHYMGDGNGDAEMTGVDSLPLQALDSALKANLSRQLPSHPHTPIPREPKSTKGSTDSAAASRIPKSSATTTAETGKPVPSIPDAQSAGTSVSTAPKAPESFLLLSGDLSAVKSAVSQSSLPSDRRPARNDSTGIPGGATAKSGTASAKSLRSKPPATKTKPPKSLSPKPARVPSASTHKGPKTTSATAGPAAAKAIRTNSATFKPPATVSSKSRGVRTATINIMANWDAPIMKKKRNQEPRLFTKLSAVRGAELSARNEIAAPVENYTLFDPSNHHIVQQGKELPKSTEAVTTPLTETALKFRDSASSSSPAPPSELSDIRLSHAESIPLSCPYWSAGTACQSSPSCFFQHTKMTSAASHMLFDQAEQEARKEGYFKYKFGFHAKFTTCSFWRVHGCLRTNEECFHAHWVSNQPQKVEKTCYYWANIGCKLPEGQCKYLHKMTEDVAAAPPYDYRRMSEPIVNVLDSEPSIMQTPIMQIPIVETPIMQTPIVETPIMEAPDMETPIVETPTLGTPTLGTPTLGTPTLGTPNLETPTLEATNGKVNETCHYWANGNCKLSAQACKYLHIRTEKVAAPPGRHLRTKSSTLKIQTPCHYWSRGFCKNSAEECNYLHATVDPTASPSSGSAFNINQPGSEHRASSREDWRSYHSDRDNRRMSEPAPRTSKKIQVQCHFWARGRCKQSAEDCPYVHGARERAVIPADAKFQTTCRFWVRDRCPKSAEECEFLHDTINEVAPATGKSNHRMSESSLKTPKTKVQELCRFWRKRNCKFSDEECDYLHGWLDDPNRIVEPPSNFTSTSKVIREIEAHPDRTQPVDLSQPVVNMVDMKCSLNFSGCSVEVVMTIPTAIHSIIAQHTQLSLNLESWALAEHLRQYGDLHLSEQLAAGPVICYGEGDKLTAFLDFLRDHLAGAVVTLPSISIVFFPSSEDWAFLQPVEKSRAQFFFHISRAGDLLAPRQLRVGSGDTSYAYMSNKLSIHRNEFFKQSEKKLRAQVFFLVPGSWSAEKEIITRYFRESGVVLIYSNWGQFVDTSQGLLIVHPDFNLVHIQHVPRFSTILIGSFNVFRIGTDSRLGTFHL